MMLDDEDKQWLTARLQAMEDRLIEKMRQVETTLLKAFQDAMGDEETE